MERLKIRNSKKIEGMINAYIQNSDEGRYAFRLCSLKMLLNDPDCSAEKLSKIMTASPRSIAKWVHKINESGDIEQLRDKARPGRSSRLSEVQMKQIRGAISIPPRDSGIDANLWDGKTLSHYVKRTFGVDLQVRQCQRLFQKLGFSLRRPRTVVAKADPAAKRVFKKTPVNS
jgi:transposase